MGQSLVSLLQHSRRVVWSPLEKAVQGIIEGIHQGFFHHDHEGFFPIQYVVELGSNHGCDLKGRAIHCYYAGKKEPLACCAEIGRLDQHFGSSWGNKDHRKRASDILERINKSLLLLLLYQCSWRRREKERVVGGGCERARKGKRKNKNKNKKSKSLEEFCA